MTISPRFDSALFRATLGSFATGIAVATCRTAEKQPQGITINSLTSVSLQPPLVLFCLSEQTRVYKSFMAAPQFALNILAQNQENLSRHFAGTAEWAEIALHPATQPDQPPLLAGCIGWMICKKHATHAGGDHAIIVGEVTGLGHDPHSAPLLYFRKHYKRF